MRRGPDDYDDETEQAALDLDMSRREAQRVLNAGYRKTEGHCCNPNEPCPNGVGDGTECTVCGTADPEKPRRVFEQRWYCEDHGPEDRR